MPETLFAAGRQGFTRSLSAFETTNGTYAGVWEFLGQQATIDGLPEVCADRGDEGACKPTDEVALNKIWRFVTRVVADQFVKANSLAGKTWKPIPEKRLFIVNRGSKTLATLRQALNKYYNSYTCEVVMASCRTIKVNKNKIRDIFSRLYGKVPRGLESLNNDQARRKLRLEKLLKDIPNEVSSCTH